MKTLIALISSIIFTGLNAQASSGNFGYLYTADTHGKGTWEYEQYNTLRSGKGAGDYNALDARFALETGITDKLQISVYLNSSYVNINNNPDFAKINEYDVNGISVEFLYNILSPYKDGMGLALYIEPEVDVRSSKSGQITNKRAIDTKLILQKNFMDDTLITAVNLQLEPEWKRSATGDYTKGLEAGIYAGVTYRVMDRIHAGIEIVNNFEYADMNFAEQEFYAWFAGPTMTYGSEKYWWTLTALPQIGAWPKTDADLNLEEKEKFQVRFKFGIPFGETEH